MVIVHERFAVGVLNPFKLEPALAIELTAIGNGAFDRGELQKVVFAFAWPNEQ
jgi:hypothetical protein